MDLLHRLVTAEPLLALFVTIALGYLVGKIKIGSFVLGGIAGTLLVGVVIGQLGVSIDPGIKGIFFALFIYAVGFQGGPQFFHALNRRSLNQLASAFVMCFVGLLCVPGRSLDVRARPRNGGWPRCRRTYPICDHWHRGRCDRQARVVARTNEDHADQRRGRLRGLLHLWFARPNHHGQLVPAADHEVGYPRRKP